MSRKDFISDNLVNMRERLKKNYEDHQLKNNISIPESTDEERVFPEPSGVPEDSGVSEAKSIPVDKPTPVPAEKTVTFSAETIRTKRELYAHIIHDLAAADQKKTLLMQKMHELDKFSAVLNGINADLQSAGDSETGVIQKKYYSAKGSWSAFEQENTLVAGVVENSYPAAVGNDKSALWIAAAILSAGIIVSLVLIGIFS